MSETVVFSLEKRFQKLEKPIRRMAFKALRALGSEAAVEIYLTGDSRMRFLNKKFRGKDEPAAVLSFGFPAGFISPPLKPKPLGEIYLNIPLIKRGEKNRTGAAFEAALAKLIIHGLVHLFGYTHRRKNDRIKMEKLEKKLATRV